MGKSALSTYTPLTQNNTRVNPLLQSTVLSNSKPPSNKKLMQSKTPQYNAHSTGYEAYLKEIGNILGDFDGKNPNKVLIKPNVGKIFQIDAISYPEFLQRLQDKATLPTKQDYINQHNQSSALQEPIVTIPSNVTTPASTPSDQDSLLNKDEEKNEEETKLKNKEESDNNEEPIADQGSLNTNDDTSETSTDTEESSQTEQEIYSSLINSQILAHSRGVSVLEQLKTSQIFATLKKSVSDQNLSPLPLSQSLLSSYVAPEGINLANSQLLERSLNQDDNKPLDEVKQNCKTILENIKQPDHFVKFVKNILGNKNFVNASSLDTSPPSELTTSKIGNESCLLPSQILLFKEVLTQYVINHFANELILGEENSECHKAYQALKPSSSDSINITTATNDKPKSVDVLINSLPQKLIELHPKVAIALFALCFPDANIAEFWEQFASDKIMLDLWEKLNTAKNQDLTLQEFGQEYFPGYPFSEDSLQKTLSDFLGQEESYEEESESSKNKKNEEIIQQLLPIIDNPIFTERINSADNTLEESDNCATPIKSALSAAEATSFVQFLCLSIILLHPESDLPLPKNWTQYVQTENPINDNYLAEIANDKDGIEEFSKKILLLKPQIIIETFNNIFPDENIIVSWHLLFPNCSIEQLWQEEKFKDLTLKEFWDDMVSDGVKLDQAQEYKDLAMLKSATKSDIVNTDNQLDQSTCDNGLGTSQLPSPEELKDTFEAAIHQAGNQALAQKILQYNYPEENSANNPEDTQINEEAVLSQDEAQFFRNFVCAMILKNSPDLANQYLQNSQQECKNETQILQKNQSILDLIKLEHINELADTIALKLPKDVVQWFEMCFPNVHLPKAWEVVFPDSSIMTLWENKNQLAADTFSQFCQIVFPNYKVSEKNLDPAQKQNFDLFLNNKATDTLDVILADLSSCFEGLFAESAIGDLQTKSKDDSDSSSSSEEEEEPVVDPQIENGNIILYYNTLTHLKETDIPPSNPLPKVPHDDSDSSTEEEKVEEKVEPEVDNRNITLYYTALNPLAIAEVPSEDSEDYTPLSTNINFNKLLLSQCYDQRNTSYMNYLESLNTFDTSQKVCSHYITRIKIQDLDSKKTFYILPVTEQQWKKGFRPTQDMYVHTYKSLQESQSYNNQPIQLSDNQLIELFPNVTLKTSEKEPTEGPSSTNEKLTIQQKLPEQGADALAEAKKQCDQASKGFFAAFFDSVSGFTSSILSSIGSIFKSKNPTISELDMTKTNSGGAGNQETATDELTPTSTPKSQSFLSKIFGGMFESIGALLGISATTEGLGDITVPPSDSDNKLSNLTGNTNTETSDNVE